MTLAARNGEEGSAVLTVRDLRRLMVAASFDLPPGEAIAVQGASGSGKTVLLRAIADLDPSDGTVELDGVPREHMTGPAWRRQVTYVATEPGWWAETVGQHFAGWDQAAPMLERLGLPSSCDGWTVQQLSTGERQRIGLVRTLVLGSRVLLLDEPTSGLDPDATAAVERLLHERMADGTGIVWVTHDREQARRVATRLLVLNGGATEERRL